MTAVEAAEQSARARAAFLAERKSGLGGSDAAAALGVSPYKSPVQLWLEKTGRAPDDAEATGHMLRGQRLESVAAREYVEREATEGRTVLLRRDGKLRRHPEHPWMIAHIDRRVVGERRLVEIKCPSVAAFRRLQRDGLPAHYVLQVQHYLAVMGFDLATWVILCADQWEMLSFDVPRNEGVIHSLITGEREFWRHVEADEPPAPDGKVPEIEIEAARGTVEPLQDEVALAAIERLREAEALRADATILHDEAVAAVKAALPGHGGYSAPGAIVYFREQQGRASFDRHALEAARPLDREKVRRALEAGGELPVPDAVLAACEMDLAQFERRGRPFETFRSYFRGGDR